MPTYRPPVEREGGLVLVLGPIIAWLVYWSALLGWHVDDAGITYAYARNLADGHGFVPFVGGEAVEGFSNPAWTLLLSVPAWLGVPVTGASKALQAGLGSLTLLGVHSLVHSSTGSRAEATATALLAGVCTPFLLWSASGLETALLAAALVGFLEAVQRDRPAWWVGVTAGVVGLSRPEGPVLALALFGAAELLVPMERWHKRRAIAGSIALIAVASWLAFRLYTFGAPFPNTWWAKVRGSADSRSWGGLLYVVATASQLGVPLLAVGWITGWRAHRLRPLTRATSWMLLVVTGCAIWVGGDWMRYGRLLAHAVPMLALACTPGLMTLFLRPRDVGRTRVEGAGRALMILYGAGFFAIQIAFSYDALRRPPIPMSGVRTTTEVLLAAATERCGAPPTIATPDLGALLYHHPEVRVIDLAGLVDREGARARGDRYWPARIRAERPEAVFVHGPWVLRTGLDAQAMDADYGLACTGLVAPRQPTPLFYIPKACDRPLSGATARRLRHWCAAQP